MTARRYVFTWNNYPPVEDVHAAADIAVGSGKLDYFCAQEELAPTTGTPHLQGWLYTSTPCRMPAVLKLFKIPGYGQMSLKVALKKFTDQQREDYCTGEQPGAGCIIRAGEFPSGQGARTDIAVVTQAIDEGMTRRELAREFPEQFVRYHRGFDAYRSATRQDRCIDEFHLFIVSGHPGTGKTTAAMEHFSDAYWYTSSPGGWAQRYDGETTLVFDEFNGTHIEYNRALSIFSKGKAELYTKGGSEPCMASTAIILSNQPWSFFYDFSKHNQ